MDTRSSLLSLTSGVEKLYKIVAMSQCNKNFSTASMLDGHVDRKHQRFLMEIARSSIVMIPGRRKPLVPYHDNTMMVHVLYWQ